MIDKSLPSISLQNFMLMLILPSIYLQNFMLVLIVSYSLSVSVEVVRRMTFLGNEYICLGLHCSGAPTHLEQHLYFTVFIH